MTEPMIEARALVKRFGSATALGGIDLAAEKGTTLALLGPNGAGKTTLVRILTTLLKPDSGRASVAGYDVTADPGPVRSAIGLAGQYAAVDELLTGRENLELAGLLYHLGRAERRRRAQQALERFSLASWSRRTRAGCAGAWMWQPALSAGQRSCCWTSPPPVWQLIEELVAGGTTVLLTTQYMEEAERLAHRIVVIDTGTVIAEGTAGELKDQMGGDVLAATVTDRADLPRASALLAPLGEGPPHLDPDQQRVSVPARDGTTVLIAAGQRLAGAGIALDDLGIRRPSLDDVFLALTGNAGPADEPAPRAPCRALERRPDHVELHTAPGACRR